MLSVHDHPIVQQIDSHLKRWETDLSNLKIKRIALTTSLLRATYDNAQLLCRNLNIQEKKCDVALLCGYEFLTNQQMVEQWLLEQFGLPLVY
ncbi:hypothetical protein [Psychromonas sp. CD1]|uniref:hypothetical protein n=1 Tax=Psychromonas sp. CD1 TaxID=1979839 RepID=UPI000B9A5408|nr:hypothetical protein [Psychromonas sp. CD1]